MLESADSSVASLKTMSAPGRSAARLLVVVHRQADLLEVIGALNAAARLARRLHGRQEQGDQDRDDGDDHQQLDQCESGTIFHGK